jgi:hypothetical protein
MNADTFAWQDSALCAQMDPDLWHVAPHEGGRYTVARDYCLQCPVLTECRLAVLAGEWGLPATERRGVWAAMTPAGRVKAERGLTAQGVVMA